MAEKGDQENGPNNIIRGPWPENTPDPTPDSRIVDSKGAIQRALGKEGKEGDVIQFPTPASAKAASRREVGEVLAKAKEPVDIDEVNIKDPRQAYNTLRQALNIVRQAKLLPFDDNDLYFKRFEGNLVGEALDDGKIVVDPVLLMHPASRLAHIVMHEMLHNNRRDGKSEVVENDAVVEAYLRQRIKELGYVDEDFLKVSKNYETAMDKFYELVERMAGSEDRGKMIEKIYACYYSGNYESIYRAYKKNYIDDHADDQPDPFDLFEEVFPELEVNIKNDDFHFQLRPPKPEEKSDGEDNIIPFPVGKKVTDTVEIVKGGGQKAS